MAASTPVRSVRVAKGSKMRIADARSGQSHALPGSGIKSMGSVSLGMH